MTLPLKKSARDRGGKERITDCITVSRKRENDSGKNSGRRKKKASASNKKGKRKFRRVKRYTARRRAISGLFFIGEKRGERVMGISDIGSKIEGFGDRKRPNRRSRRRNIGGYPFD